MFQKPDVEIIKTEVYDVITASDFADWEKTGDEPVGNGNIIDWFKQLF